MENIITDIARKFIDNIKYQINNLDYIVDMNNIDYIIIDINSVNYLVNINNLIYVHRRPIYKKQA